MNPCFHIFMLGFLTYTLNSSVLLGFGGSAILAHRDSVGCDAVSSHEYPSKSDFMSPLISATIG
jgi:hypothetical protein